MLLKNEVFGGDVVLIGDDSGLQGELLRSLEGVGGGDEIGGEAASEEFARRTGGEEKETDCRENEFRPHEPGLH